MDFSKLSDSDLEAIKAGDMSRVSDAGLALLSGQQEQESRLQVERSVDVARQIPTGRSTVTGMTPDEAYSRGLAGSQQLTEAAAGVAAPALRYGLPVAATAIAASNPATAPAAVANVLRMMGVSAASSAIGEGAAMGVEAAAGQREASVRDFIRQSAAAGAYGSAPTMVGGGFMTRAALNVPSYIAASELGRFIENGMKYEGADNTVDALVRYGLPGSFGAASSLGGKLSGEIGEARARSAAVSGQRFGRGPVLLSEAMPRYTETEAAALKRANPFLIRRLEKIEANIGDEIKSAFGDIPDTGNLANDLRERAGMLTRYQDEYNRAKAEADRLSAEAAEAERTRYMDAPELRRRADEKAFEAIKARAAYDGMVTSVFGGNAPVSQAVATGERIFGLQKLAGEASRYVRENISRLYDNSGVDVNDAVVSFDSVKGALAEARGSGILKDNAKFARISKIVETYFPSTADGPRVLTRGQFQELRNDIFDGLLKDGMSREQAHRLASETYGVVRNASDNFLAAANPDGLRGLRAAEAVAAADFAARESPVIDMLAAGDIDGIYEIIRKEGFGPAAKSIDAYGSMIAGSGSGINPEVSVRASEQFKSGFNALIGKTVIDRSMDAGRGKGFYGGERIINPATLAQEVDALASKGYPVELLGLGNPEQLRKLAKIAGANTPGGLRVDELDEFFNMVNEVGVDGAMARRQYQNLATQEYLAGPGGRQVEKAKKTAQIAADARIKAEERVKLLEAARNDPLVLFMDGTKAKLGNDVAQNVNWSNRVLQMPPDVVTDMTSALGASGRTGDLIKLRKAATAGVMLDFVESLDKRNIPNMKKLFSFFYGDSADDIQRRASLKALLGEQEWKNFEGSFGRAIKSAVSSEARLYETPRNIRVFRGSTFIRPDGAPFTLSGGLQGAIELAQNARYGLLYNLYVDPQWSKKWQAAGYNMERFLANNANAGVMVRLADQADEESKAANQPPRQ